MLSELMSLFMHMPLPARILSFLLFLLKTSPINLQSFQDSLSLSTLTQCLLGSVQLKVFFFSCALFQHLASVTHRALIIQHLLLPWSMRIWISGSLPHFAPALDSTFLKVRVNFSQLGNPTALGVEFYTMLEVNNNKKKVEWIQTKNNYMQKNTKYKDI